MTVFFHGNFGLNRARMSQLLEVGLANPLHRDKDLARSFGYGAPFAAAYRSWLHKTGIIELRFPMTLTSFGEVIRRNDLKLNEKTTLLFMHQRLTDQSQRAEAWHFFMGEFQEANPLFTKEDLRQALSMKLSAHDATHFGPESKMIPIIVRKLLECYTSDTALSSLGMLEKVDQQIYEFANTAHSPTYNSPKELEAAFPAN